MPNPPPVALTLSNLGIAHRVFKHSGEIKSLEQAASQRGQNPQQVVRSLLFRIREGSYVMVLIAGPAQVSWPALRNILGQSRISLASPAQVLAVTGYQIGTVSPIGLPGPVRILADENVFIPDEISIGSGERGIAVILKSVDLHTAIGNIQIGKLAENHDP